VNLGKPDFVAVVIGGVKNLKRGVVGRAVFGNEDIP